MAIYDNNGTTNAEIGKLYDNNGTVNTQTGKVYDNNGTVNSLLYSAVEAFTVVPDEAVYPASKWTLALLKGSYNEGAPNHYCRYNGNTLELQIYGWNKMFQGYFIPVTINGQTKMTVNGSSRDLGKSDIGWNAYVKLCSEKTMEAVTGGIGCAIWCPEDGNVNLSGTFDISPLGDGEKYLFVGTENISSSGGVRSNVYITGLNFSE